MNKTLFFIGGVLTIAGVGVRIILPEFGVSTPSLMDAAGLSLIGGVVLVVVSGLFRGLHKEDSE